MIPLVQREVVRKGWILEDQFLELHRVRWPSIRRYLSAIGSKGIGALRCRYLGLFFPPLLLF